MGQYDGVAMTSAGHCSDTLGQEDYVTTWMYERGPCDSIPFPMRTLKHISCLVCQACHHAPQDYFQASSVE